LTQFKLNCGYGQGSINMRATILCGLLAGVLAGTVQSAPINGTYNTILDDGSGNVQVSNANGCGTVAFSNGVGTTLLGNNVCRQFSNAIDRMCVRHGCTCMTFK
jgi:hypothetical protein